MTEVYNGKFIYQGNGIYKGVESKGSVTIDGKTYETMKIGNLIWMVENLDASTANSVSREGYLNTNIRLTGYRNKNGEFVSFGITAPFWTTDEASDTTSYTPVFQLQYFINPYVISQGSHTYLSPTAISVRVVKDV